MSVGLLWPALAAWAAVAPSAAAAAQDTTRVMRVRGVRVEVPRPSTTAGGSSAVEIATDSLSIVAAPTAAEFLRRVPLLQMRTNSRGEVQPDLRGADDRQIAVLLDGVPLTLGWDHRTDLSIVPFTAVRTVTLVRGLSSMLHGPNVLGGALELDVARGRRPNVVGDLFAGAFSIDREGATSIAAVATSVLGGDGTITDESPLSVGEAGWILRAGGGYRNSPGATLPGGARTDPRLNPLLLADDQGRRLNSDRVLRDGFVSARYQNPDGAWLSTLVTAMNAVRGVTPEAHVADPRLWRYPDQDRLVVALAGGTAERSGGRGEGYLHASFGLDRSSTTIDEYATPAYQSVVGGETGLTTTVTGRVLGDHRLRAGPEIRSALTLAHVGHTETFHDGESFDYGQRLWSLGTEVEIRGDDESSGEESSAVWSVGASVDGSDTPLSGDKPPLGAIWDWGVRTGVTMLGSGGSIVYHAGVSRRTRFPSLRELYSGALGRFDPNPDLKSESLQAAEAGLTFSLGDSRLQVVGFHQRLGDGIVRTRTVTPGGIRFKRVNRDVVRSTGLEILAVGSGGPLNIGGDLTLKRVRISDPELGDQDSLAEYEPAVSGTLNIGVMAPQEVNVNGFVRYRGVQYCENVEIHGLDRMSASATVDLEVGRTFAAGAPGSGGDPAASGRSGGRRLTGTVGVANLTDSTVLDQCGLPQPGRTLRIQFNLR